MEQNRRGVLYPKRLPEFHRLPPSSNLAHAVRWFWIPEWDLPDGVESRQELLPYPACNLVVDSQGMSISGPATQRSERVLTGRGWAVGALLRPASAMTIARDPRSLRDTERQIEAPDLHAAMMQIMDTRNHDAGQDHDGLRQRAAETLEAWIAKRTPLPEPGSDGALANALEDHIAEVAITRADQLPDALHTSARTLQRIADRAFGIGISAMIRRRRLQEAAERLRAVPDTPLADLANELGYTDHAHFSTEFKRVIGMTPRDYRVQVGR